MAEKRWTHDELKGLLERGTIHDLERLIAEPGRQDRQEFAHDYAISALRNIAESEVLPDDIRQLALQVLELHKVASNPFLGMDSPSRKGTQA